MNKVALLTDMHWGVKKGDEDFLESLKIFLDEVFFPECKKRGINHIINLGDIVHVRKRIDFHVLTHMREVFLDRLVASNMKMTIIVGNHDMPFSDVMDSNACDELFEGYSNISVVSEVTEFPSMNTIMIPWMTKSSREDTLEKIAKSKMKFAMGHLELNGFSFSKVQTAFHGDDPKNFSKFERVMSGHYHYRHNKDNIYYLGSPTEQTWIDVNTTRGFHIFDTATGDLEFINNPYNMFENVNYGEEDFFNNSHRRYVRLYVSGEEKLSDREEFIDRLYKGGAIKVDVIRNKEAKVIQETESIIEPGEIDVKEDTPTFIRRNVDNEKVADILINLYNRASTEVI